jgi:hypothetical protein
MAVSTDARDLCSVALVMCMEWLERNAPEAVVLAEVEPEQFAEVHLVTAARYALARLRIENERTGDR